MGFWTPWNPTGADVPMPWDKPATPAPTTTQLPARIPPSINGADYTWQVMTPTVNPQASPMVTNPTYSQYPSGWGVKPVTPTYQAIPSSPTVTGWDTYPINTADVSYANTTNGQASTYKDPATGMTFPSFNDYLNYVKFQWQKSVYQPTTDTSAADASYKQQQLTLQQQQLDYQRQQDAAQLAAEKEARLAQLAAQPKSWLEYAAYANQTPVVQPWMLPLMPQDYMKTQPVGSPIQGWTPENMKGMPDLINPSAQYLARMGPTAQDQYYAYQQADQGMTPEESQWRLWSIAPPAGSNRGLAYQR